jgi:uncharacterized protein YkwD
MTGRFALPLLFVLAASAAAETPPPAADITAENVVRVINDYRARHDLPPVVLDTRLDLAAGDRMADMVEQGYWSHRSPQGKPPFDFLQPRGYAYRTAAENLATGFETVEVLVESWMESDGHRVNILTPAFTHAGVAVIEGNPARRAAGRSVVVIFAAEMVRTDAER